VGDVELARQEWQAGHRRVEELAGDPRYPQVAELVEQLVGELRARVGATYTLEELARSYAASERWANAAIGEREDWARWLAAALDSAYHRYSRGAQDYRP
jgi:hypothetical protein